MGICTTTTDMRGMGSRHGQPGMRNETVAAALAAAASLVIRRTSDQILQSRCKCLWGARAEDCALVEHLQAAGWHCDRSEPVCLVSLAQGFQAAVSLGDVRSIKIFPYK